MASDGKLIDGKPFRDWISGYVRKNYDSLSESQYFKTVMHEGGPKSWAMCSVLMNALSHDSSEKVVPNSLLERGIIRADTCLLRHLPLLQEAGKCSQHAL